ncbi:PfkB family carbohydrate kinase [Agromyces mangrovi Wang et al. 2018]|uniref:PfkB family carbohydrate kinase n=1 Tax=Agromyces mangrovi TaxID=1858653 RepID=UPI00257489FC|nr:PfkB family carbohydrate kinase [Agromyces mangrovi]BDZ65199.1 hypothetical protein GCM10025877_21370 [Agromyces mangrovi]
MAALRAQGTIVVVDTSGPALMEASYAGADLVAPNREELAAVAGTDDFDAGIDALLAAGAGGVVATDGAAGLTVALRRSRCRARLESSVEPRNPTGAGDAAVASLAAHLADAAPTAGDDALVLARRAAAWSASAVTMPLAGELAPDHDAWASRVVVTVARTEPACP